MPEPIPAPTVDDLARDLVKDLAVCEAAQAGPLEVEEQGGMLAVYTTAGRVECRWGQCVGGHQCFAEINPGGPDGMPTDQDRADALMIATARTGWPAAIRIAHHFRADNAKLRGMLAGLTRRVAEQSDLLSRRAERAG